jgi:hypothetical protein
MPNNQVLIGILVFMLLCLLLMPFIFSWSDLGILCFFVTIQLWWQGMPVWVCLLIIRIGLGCHIVAFGPRGIIFIIDLPERIRAGIVQAWADQPLPTSSLVMASQSERSSVDSKAEELVGAESEPRVSIAPQEITFAKGAE